MNTGLALTIAAGIVLAFLGINLIVLLFHLVIGRAAQQDHGPAVVTGMASHTAP